MENAKTPLALKEDVAGKYEMLKGHGVGEYRFKGHIVHLQHIDLKHADKLVNKGFPYLVEKAKVEQKKPAEAAQKA